MKRFTLFSFCFASAMLLSFCTGNNSSITDNNKKLRSDKEKGTQILEDLSTTIENMGIIHNDALEHILYSLNNEDLSIPTDPEAPGEQWLNDLDGVLIDFLENEYDEVTEYAERDFPVDNSENISDIASSSSLSNSAKQVLLDLDDAILDYVEGGSLAQLLQVCEGLIDDALSLSDETEVVICGGTVSVAMNSAQYWENNFDDWVSLYSTTKPQKGGSNSTIQLTEDEKAMFKADARGALFGGIRGAFAGGLIGAVIGGVFSGATASIYTGLFRGFKKSL